MSFPLTNRSCGRHRRSRPSRRDGWLYGRGAGDMKCGFAMGVLALRALRAAGADGDLGPLTFVAAIEEECTGNGTLAAIEAGGLADAVVVLEPTDLNLLRGRRRHPVGGDRRRRVARRTPKRPPTRSVPSTRPCHCSRSLREARGRAQSRGRPSASRPNDRCASTWVASVGATGPRACRRWRASTCASATRTPGHRSKRRRVRECASLRPRPPMPGSQSTRPRHARGLPGLRLRPAYRPSPGRRHRRARIARSTARTRHGSRWPPPPTRAATSTAAACQRSATDHARRVSTASMRPSSWPASSLAPGCWRASSPAWSATPETP